MKNPAPQVVLGLRQNWKQFSILVVINAFVGAMIGLERAIFPQFAIEIFGLESKVAILSFITAFGISKSAANYFSGKLANQFGRKNLLILGWILALPVPLILAFTGSWNWVIASNVLLGISQGLTWSSTVVMKIDLVGEKDRGFAMGLNEFAGYFAVGIFAFISGFLAQKYGIRPYPFLLGELIAIMGLLLTIFLVKDTRKHVEMESKGHAQVSTKGIFWETTFRNKTLSAITQAGLVNNLNDGMIWGLLPVLLMSLRFELEEVGLIAAIYPTVWGISQLFTGKMADIFPKKTLLFWGMLAQGIAILFLPLAESYPMLLMVSVSLGIGTAVVYPTFLAAIAEATHPHQRAESIGTFRLWRDLGYAIGAILSGITADLFGIPIAIVTIGLITIGSSLVIQFRMPKKIKFGNRLN
ncbi:MFS transporter [Algoriphagus sp.]|uniref:MFS transporter n=1 Tax=Algoriphagus sp. TaxID=1872435 RepID=UPI002723772E|nr:MFS transporter [Algoriphagus sp.]MDO8967547.1 MFS transporter [Algoriphagus sp.]MDP3199026.1 MFS transporter [Algoriphagus sp.]